MINNKIIFVEKKSGFDVQGKILLKDFKENLNILNLERVRVVNKYIISNLEEEYFNKSLYTIFSEKPVDNLYLDEISLEEGEIAFSVEYLPGQYDMRKDSAEECLMLLTGKHDGKVKSERVLILKGNLDQKEIEKIKNYYINPVDSRETDIYSNDINETYKNPEEVEILNGFTSLSKEDLEKFHKEFGLCMSLNDLSMIKDYFENDEKRDPSITEIKVIDTYWSDHCRHTTFETSIKEIQIEENKFNDPVKKAYEAYLKSREFVYGKETSKEVKLMDIACIVTKELLKKGEVKDLDISEEINACSINVDVKTDKGIKEYLLMFKNETHNHPTEIEPFGGAATCLGGAIRDPLSGRAYVYGAMRVTGSGDPTAKVSTTLKGKLPQRTITIDAAKGYSSYGNQIGLATGQVDEVYHDNYVAKRMEVGAVIAAVPKENVVREEPTKGDVVILLGGRTGRDGVGGATGSSKEHTVDSINECGAEVQKGNPVVERKIQRLFRNKEASRLIKRCNDFGAGGVSVAIGELSRGLDIYLDKVPKKYEGLDGTELAVSESQERMAVVVREEDAKRFIELSREENLEAVIVSDITNTDRLKMIWKDKEIVNIKREFLDTNGYREEIDIKVASPKEYPFKVQNVNVKEKWLEVIKDLNCCSKKGLIERFDSTIGGNTVLMPLGGLYQKTPAEGLAFKIPVMDSESKSASLMTYGFNPALGVWSPFHMAYYSVIESVTKIVAMGGDYKNIRLSLQEYFEKLGNDKERWGKPFSALLGAYKAQIDFNIPAIGGKDSMSGSFGEIDVPPSLVSFAVTTEDSERIISPEFKRVDSKIVLLKTFKNPDMTIDIEKLKENFNKVYKLIGEKKIISAYSLKSGGVAEGITKMCFGNKIGANLFNLSTSELFDLDYGTMILEIPKDINIEAELNGLNHKIIGETIGNAVIISKSFDIYFKLHNLEEIHEEKLQNVFKAKLPKSGEKIKEKLIDREMIKYSKEPIENPLVVIPVFPGTNCEYDSKRAFLRAGAKVSEVLIRNTDKESLEESIEILREEISKAQIIMLPGGFSAGDEPDGSAKFIATVFRNEKIKNAVNDLLENREGLVLGICNGFQALIKLGLVPYGKIIDLEEDMLTLTYNDINRHMSTMVRTKVTSNLSPWFKNVNLGDIHTVPISHGEGKIVGSKELIEKLINSGQIATQYVDLNGEISMDMPFNPNGSLYGIEGMTSFDGRVLGKMAHSERTGEDLYKNIYGNFDQSIFKSGVDYFRKR